MCLAHNATSGRLRLPGSGMSHLASKQWKCWHVNSYEQVALLPLRHFHKKNTLAWLAQPSTTSHRHEFGSKPAKAVFQAGSRSCSSALLIAALTAAIAISVRQAHGEASIRSRNCQDRACDLIRLAGRSLPHPSAAMSLMTSPDSSRHPPAQFPGSLTPKEPAWTYHMLPSICAHSTKFTRPEASVLSGTTVPGHSSPLDCARQGFGTPAKMHESSDTLSSTLSLQAASRARESRSLPRIALCQRSGNETPRSAALSALM